MKFLINLCLLITVIELSIVRSEELTKENALAAANDCKDETGATDDDIAAILEHKPADSTEGKCLRSCVMKKFGIMNDDGKLVKEKTLEVAQIMITDDNKKELAIEVVEACENLSVNEDHCEAAIEYGACLKEHAEEQGLLPPDF
ncbi:general odorant-binding protein 19d-like [Glossina fuscipes]|uniref:General odorant-binding protein 19d-like n=2 Tax=Nemorhina TaxID=44051 RepID=A0A9C6DTK5_9MUSC|nr:general odorant-binding protein 19d-like [Glossina fuscipes]